MDSPSIIPVAAVLGLSSTIWISGLGFSAAHLTLPSLYNQPTKPATQVFKRVYSGGAAIVIPLTILATASFGSASYLSSGNARTRFALATFFTLINLPYTQLVMMQGISVLMDCADNDQVREKTGDRKIVSLLQDWQTRATIRAGFYFIAGALGASVLAI